MIDSIAVESTDSTIVTPTMRFRWVLRGEIASSGFVEKVLQQYFQYENTKDGLCRIHFNWIDVPIEKEEEK